MINLKKFAERLDELIYETHLQQKEFALNAKISPSDICRYLQGNIMPSVNCLIKIADYTECNINYLLGIEDTQYICKPRKLQPFNERLRFLLKHFGYSGYRFCKEVEGISSASFYEWLSGEYQPNTESIVKIAEFFHCTVDFVLGRSDTE